MANTDKNAPLDVAIAIVSHRHSEFIGPCLDSVFNHPTRARCKVTLLDNVGENSIRELVTTKFPQVELLVNRTPRGFAENNNAIFRGSTARYLFLLNPDTVLHEGTIDALVDYMDTLPTVGACGPRLLYPDGRLQLSCREFPTLGSLLIRRTPLRRWLGNGVVARRYTMADWDHNTARPVGWVFGAALLVRREAWEAVGPLDGTMFMYCEDIDWCLRCRLGGWEVHYVPEARIIHHLDDQKYNDYLTKSRRQHYRTMLRFLLKYPRYCLRW